MPTVDVQVIEDVFTLEEKQKLINGIARVFGEVAGEWMRDNTTVRIHEVKSGQWGGADSCWTTEIARSMKSAPV